jgi:hypothetical protein
LADKGVVVLGVNDEDQEDVRWFLRVEGFTFTTVTDANSRVGHESYK